MLKHADYAEHLEDLVKAVLAEMHHVQKDEIDCRIQANVKESSGTRLSGSCKGSLTVRGIHIFDLPKENHNCDIEVSWQRGKITSSRIAIQAGNTRKHYYSAFQRGERFIVHIAGPIAA